MRPQWVKVPAIKSSRDSAQSEPTHEERTSSHTVSCDLCGPVSRTNFFLIWTFFFQMSNLKICCFLLIVNLTLDLP